jgi:hypothetical protein
MTNLAYEQGSVYTKIRDDLKAQLQQLEINKLLIKT